MFLAGVVMVLCNSCALFDSSAGPREKYSAAQEAYIVAVSAVLELKRADVISPEHYKDIVLPIIREGDRLSRYDEGDVGG